MADLLADLGAEVSNLEKAQENARAFAGEVLAKLREASRTAKVA